MPRVGRRVRVTGRVQGVFFRVWTKQQADELGVSGWVRNCRDGSVEALLSGEDPAVDELIALMSEGPPGASVEHVEVEEAPHEALDRFEVRH